MVMSSDPCSGRVDRPFQALQAPEDAQPGDDSAGKRPVVVKEPDRSYARTRVALGRPCEERAVVAGAVQERGAPISRKSATGVRRDVRRRPDRESHSPEEGATQEQLRDPERTGEAVSPPKAQDDRRTVEETTHTIVPSTTAATICSRSGTLANRQRRL